MSGALKVFKLNCMSSSRKSQLVLIFLLFAKRDDDRKDFILECWVLMLFNNLKSSVFKKDSRMNLMKQTKFPQDFHDFLFSQE